MSIKLNEESGNVLIQEGLVDRGSLFSYSLDCEENKFLYLNFFLGRGFNKSKEVICLNNSLDHLRKAQDISEFLFKINNLQQSN